MTEEQRDGILISLSEQVSLMTNKIDTVEENLTEKISAVEDRLTIKINDVDKKIDAVEDKLTKKINVVEKTLTDELIRQRKNLAKTENNLSEKIEALFDVREINSDKFQEHDEKLESIMQALDRHHSRIFKLESKAN